MQFLNISLKFANFERGAIFSINSV